MTPHWEVEANRKPIKENLPNANLTFQAAITGVGRCYLSAFSAEMVTAPWQGFEWKSLLYKTDFV
jgi:hypothetical protein